VEFLPEIGNYQAGLPRQKLPAAGTIIIQYSNLSVSA